MPTDKEETRKMMQEDFDAVVAEIVRRAKECKQSGASVETCLEEAANWAKTPTQPIPGRRDGRLKNVTVEWVPSQGAETEAVIVTGEMCRVVGNYGQDCGSGNETMGNGGEVSSSSSSSSSLNGPGSSG